MAPSVREEADSGRNRRASPAMLSLTVVCSKVRFPQLSMPAPNAHAIRQGLPPGQGGPAGIARTGSAMLPVITLSEIVTVAPLTGSPSAGTACGGISMPPPAATTPFFPQYGTDSWLERARPPVI